MEKIEFIENENHNETVNCPHCGHLNKFDESNDEFMDFVNEQEEELDVECEYCDEVFFIKYAIYLEKSLVISAVSKDEENADK